MTSSRRLEQDLPALLADLYVIGTPDYRDDIVQETARVRQRPSWTFLTRWIPMDVATRRLAFAPLPMRMLVILALLIVVAIVGVLVGVGSQQRVPPPFGPARNGPLAYTQGEAIYARDSILAPERLLIGGDGTKNGFWGYSPDGTRILFQRATNGGDHLFVADADGRNPRQLLDLKLEDAYGAWSPDGRTIAVANGARGIRRLLLAHVDGSPPVEIDLKTANPTAYGQLHATDLAWRPPNGAELLVRAEAFDRTVDFYRVRADGTVLGRLNLKDLQVFGPQWDVSGPAWSPTGDRIAYNQVEPLQGDPDGHFRIHVVQPDGTGDIVLPGPVDPLVHEAWPVWSPDGRWIAVEHFTFGDPGDDWLALLPSDGSGPARDLLPRRVAHPDGGIVKTWLPDGSRLIARNNGSGAMFSIDPVTGAVEEITWSAVDLPDTRRLAP
jgi:dipeptidyl aminopeptidase/acylaminoacyl peptidase